MLGARWGASRVRRSARTGEGGEADEEKRRDVPPAAGRGVSPPAFPVPLP
jgi:hypothetical protein